MTNCNRKDNSEGDTDDRGGDAVDETGVTDGSDIDTTEATTGAETATEVQRGLSGEASTDSSATPDDEPPTRDRTVTMSYDEGTTTTQSDAAAGSTGTIRYETTPMLRPVLLLLSSVLLCGTVALAIPMFRPDLFGDPVIAEIVQYAIAVLVTVTVVRFSVQLVVLWRTRYEIRDDALIRRYNLAYKRTVRKIPVSKLRGHEFTQSRYQASLGVGTIRLLTAGTNRSLGFLAFEHLREPEVVQAHIQRLLAEQAQNRDRLSSDS
ncbi:PH domain-containing protein [Halopiger aswanensis]|uniref:PH (Pleckstrin Homology) domain-containing protein n=1 Tax=Halopiger aswanensis TaxID=148449 RepID=A0A3R7HH79_9EURY|nr:PH domain-containing protein [Halopiger aswanensis]RKD93560.1 PH (Pleckstrin Homology) domain-containing protein [Halopiger aswanensis]